MLDMSCYSTYQVQDTSCSQWKLSRFFLHFLAHCYWRFDIPGTICGIIGYTQNKHVGNPQCTMISMKGICIISLTGFWRHVNVKYNDMIRVLVTILTLSQLMIYMPCIPMFLRKYCTSNLVAIDEQKTCWQSKLTSKIGFYFYVIEWFAITYCFQVAYILIIIHVSDIWIM